ncbi:tetratricopeptide repeat protein [Fluviicola taffensis]|uniref:Tetratricopeptide TPR_1 repeat-containing protein n=1 Tax=Fluviicola taffensis (strain DSM 16823 / NCIMB 13979 / RW262) TaxID=755732 RepID=F2IB15_FLUTR|nr:tetratricopeptide repeat protein [Fluviicola taffensis]AEA42098.1 Tetratricopeptide TPR_1 repeat-containing protein [Fluviicola taffensis DSM 16823]
MSKKNASSVKQSSQKASAVIPSVDQSLVIRRRLFWMLSIAAFLLFAPTIGHGFVLDDIAVIENNRFVQEGFGGIPDLFSTFYWKGFWDANAGLYRPLSMVMFAIEWAISANNPAIHHFINVFLYALTIGVLFKLLLKLLPTYSIWVSFAIALIFMVHPSHTEVVANIKSRDEILCFLFFLLTFLSLLKARSGKPIDAVKTALLFFACLLSKEAGVMYLPIFGLYFWMAKKESIGSVLKKSLPLIVITGAWLILHQQVIHADPTPPIQYGYHDNSLIACEDGSRYATGIGVLGRYILEVVAPLNLSYDYSYNQIPCLSFTSLPVIGTLLVLILSTLIVVKTRKSKPEIAFGILFFFVSIALVTNIFSLIGTTYANRLIYAPSLGIIISFVLGIFILFKAQQSEKWQSGAILVSTLIGILFSVQTIQRNKAWESNTTLFTADVQNSPNSARVQFNYGVLKMNTDERDSSVIRQEWLLAASSFKKAISIDSLDAGSYTNLGVVSYRLNQLEQSVRYTQKAINLNPTDTSLYANLGDAYFALKNYDKAGEALKKGVQWKDASVSHYKRYGISLFNLKQYDQAITVFKKGLQKFPNDTEIASNLGNTYGAAGIYEKAGQTFETIYNQDSSNVNALRLLITSYGQAGNQDKVKQYSSFLK